MAKGDYLGEFEQLILLAVLRLGNDAYGMRVRQEIAQRTGRDAAIGAVYATLERLETKQLVTSHPGDAAPEREGRARRYFRVEAAGIEALRRSREVIDQMTKGLKQAWAK